MAVTKKTVAANIFGIISLAALASVWFFYLAPWRWYLRYPGGFLGFESAKLVAILASVLAAVLGSRKWLIVVLLAIGTLLYSVLTWQDTYVY